MEVNHPTREALARLPRPELRRMLQEELHKNTQEADDAFVRLLLAELQARGEDPAFTDDAAVAAACESFQAAIPAQKRWYQHWMLKVASAVLVLGILFFSIPAAEAKSVPDVLTWWSDSLFQLFSPGSRPNTEDFVYETDHPGLQEIHDTVVDAGITAQIVPSDLSDEFILTECKILRLEEDITIHANLISEHNIITYVATVHNQESMLQHEKKAESISVWNIAGIDHYVISNNKTLIVTWVAENIECTITTDCSEEDVYRLIESIYTSED